MKVEMKFCKFCNKEKPKTREFWCEVKKGTGKLKNICRECENTKHRKSKGVPLIREKGVPLIRFIKNYLLLGFLNLMMVVERYFPFRAKPSNTSSSSMPQF